MKTYSLKPVDVKRHWHLINASDAPLGRLATIAAGLLIGKQKPSITPHVDAGDYVVIINTDKLVITGNKASGKIYSRHSGFPGGLRQTKLADMAKQDSTELVKQAVRGMLPVNKLRAGRLSRLKIYSGGDHQHEAQNPKAISLKKERKT